jgi:hypothetical protein
MQKKRFASRFLALSRCGACIAPLALAGCPNPNLYTTPRTLEQGRVEWLVAQEVLVANYTTGDTRTNESVAQVLTSSFGVRVGLVDGFEGGAYLQNSSSLAVDGKIRLAKGRVDAAVDPGLQVYSLPGNASHDMLEVVSGRLPVLLGFNLSERATVVLSPGVVYSLSTESPGDAIGIYGIPSALGVFAMLGVGVEFRVLPHLAIHPEITATRQLVETPTMRFQNTDVLTMVGGLGLSFGAQPDYSDLAPTRQ